jgi:hypothetical protein
MGIKVYNALPSYIKMESNNPTDLKRFFLIKKNTFYSLSEYFEQQFSYIIKLYLILI